jgi:uncharacterized protein (UPF0332 family)
MTLSSEERNIVVQAHIERAKEAMEDAAVIAEQARWYASANRLYYAAYNMVTALLIKNKHIAHTHSGTLGLFGLHFVKTGLVSKERGAFFRRLFELRQNGDYDVFVSFSDADILPLLEPTRSFLAEIERLIHTDA